MIFLNNVNTNTTSDPHSFNGGQKTIVVRGDDFGGGTVDIEERSTSDPSSRYSSIAGFDSDGSKSLLVAFANMEYRAVLSGATSPSNVFAEILPD